jgi:hypothetical protein
VGNLGKLYSGTPIGKIPNIYKKEKTENAPLGMAFLLHFTSFCPGIEAHVFVKCCKSRGHEIHDRAIKGWTTLSMAHI